MSLMSMTCPVSSVRTAIRDERASPVIDCNSSPTAETIWSLMVLASVWLTRWAVRHHSKCTPTALTTMDVSTRAEIAVRMPRRMPGGPVLRGRSLTALRDHSSVCFSREAIFGHPDTAL
jgi:hypothetical protein